MAEETNFFYYEMRNYFYRIVEKEHSNKVAIICHGIMEHSGRYLELAEELIKDGYRVYIPDLLGHGQSEGKRGHVGSFTDFIYFFSAFVNFVYREEKKKIVILSHSMGGLIALHYIANEQTYDNKIKALVFSSPALKIKMPAKLYEPLKIITYRAARIFPNFYTYPPIRSKDLSRDKKRVEQRRRDPLVLKLATLSLLKEFTFHTEIMTSRNVDFLIPILVLIAGDDKLVEGQVTFDFFKKNAPELAKINYYKDSYHELIQDLNRLEVINDIKNWLKTKEE